MLKKKRAFSNIFDWLDISLILFISMIGLLSVFSATYAPHAPFSLFAKKQTIGMLTGMMLYTFTCLIDHRRLADWGHDLYIVTLCLLTFTLIKGVVGLGAQRWLVICGLKFQPAELAKLFLPAYIGIYIKQLPHTTSYHVKQFLLVLTLLAISFILILKQPDLGTALLVSITGILCLWAAGLHKQWFVTGGIMLIMSLPIFWSSLKPYQKNRIAVFLGGGTSHKERYQTEQSLIAIGSGGLSGKGFLKGTQNKLMFLPEGRTDFIFSVICEEWGLIGALCVLLLYLLLCCRLLHKIAHFHSLPDQIVGFGLLSHIFLSFMINIAMALGLAPIVGIPLPLLSYGISNLWVTYASLGWIQSIDTHQPYI